MAIVLGLDAILMRGPAVRPARPRSKTSRI